MESRYQDVTTTNVGETIMKEGPELERERKEKRKRDHNSIVDKEKEKSDDKEEGKEKEVVVPKKKKQKKFTETFTITFGDSAENHVGMQKLGTLAAEGFSLNDFENAKVWFEAHGIEVSIKHLNQALPESVRADADNAYVLIAKKGLSAFVDIDDFHAEQAVLEKDTKALMYGRVVQKHARHNLCFGDQGQEPNYALGKGRVVAFDSVELLKKVRGMLSEPLGEKGKDLLAEGNYYYDINKCGIGFHGDAERRKVVAVRTGATIPLHYQWFINGKPIGERIELKLDHGDLYIMSEKAAGTDFKKRTVYTLRHAAGAKKFLTIKKK